ncbi:MAG: hypothetical protein ISR76_05695 [Planctomycetes bacterium]|nr:hypothetical protein [Planctomycetota bacterium]MBL7008471.1 hypothetical protein [Planctomycetota bacterium]
MAHSNWIPALLAGAAAGVVGGLLAGTLMTEPSAGPETASYKDAKLPAAAKGGEEQLPAQAAAFDAPPTDIGPLADRVAGLEREIAQLRGQVAGRRRLDQPEPVMGLDPGLLEPILGEAMGAFLDEREAQEAADRRAQEEVRRQERMTRQMERLAQELGLTPNQAADMQTILTESDAKRNEFFRQAREGGDFDRDSMRDYMTRSQEELNISLGGILTIDQLALYQESNSGGMFGGRGGFGGPGGGGRQGGGGRGGN